MGSRKWGVHHGVDFLKQLFLQCDNPMVKRYALLLLVKEPGWKKVSCLLDLCEIKEEPYHSIIWRGNKFDKESNAAFTTFGCLDCKYGITYCTWSLSPFSPIPKTAI